MFKWIVSSASGVFVKSEDEMVETVGTETVEEMKEQASQADWQRAFKTVQNIKVECAKIGEIGS
jgi:hypothetical protein